MHTVECILQWNEKWGQLQISQKASPERAQFGWKDQCEASWNWEFGGYSRLKAPGPLGLCRSEAPRYHQN